MRAIVLVFLAASAAACLEPATVPCGDLLCPGGLVCAPAGDRCVTPEQITGCDELADGDRCSFAGNDGVCVDGVCEPSTCGNGQLDETEQCDGDVGETRCEDLGYYPGELRCGANCQFDVNGCAGRCGDAELNGDEACDGAPPEGVACVDFGYDLGAIPCSGLCSPSLASCERIGWRRTPMPSDLNALEILGRPDGSLLVIDQGGSVWRRVGITWSAVSTDGGIYSAMCNAADGTTTFVGASGIASYDGAAWTTLDATPYNFAQRLTCAGAEAWFVDNFTGALLHFDGTTTSIAPLSAVTWLDAWAIAPDDVWAVAAVPDGDGGLSGGLIAHFDGETWTESPTPVDTIFGSVWGSAHDDVHAVGGGGVVGHFDGESWTILDAPPSDLMSLVRGRSRTDAWAIAAREGDAAALLHWDGDAWTAVDIGDSISAVSTLWLDPAGPIYLGAWQTQPTLLESDGLMWRRDSSLDVVGNVTSTWFDANGVGYAAGTTGLMRRVPGDRWRRVESVRLPVRVVTGSAPDDVWVAGDMRWVYHFDGQSWSRIDLDVGLTDGIVSGWAASGVVFFVDFGGGIYRYDGTWTYDIDTFLTTRPHAIWGTAADDVYAVGDGGAIYHLQGSTWSLEDSGTSAHLFGIWGRAADDIYVVGGSGALLHYDGVSWEPGPLVAPEDLRDIRGADDGSLVIVGAGGALIERTADGTWVRHAPLGAGFAGELHAVAASPTGEVVVVGEGALLSRVSPGASWTSAVLGPSDSLQSMSAPTPLRAVAVSSNRVMRYDGAAWWGSDAPLLARDAWAAAPDDIYIAGEGAVYHADRVGTTLALETNGGATVWGSGPDDVYVVDADAVRRRNGDAWDAIAPGIAAVRSVAAVAPDDVFAIAGSELVHFDGTGWAVQDPGITGPAAVDAIGPGDVWAVGANGLTSHWDGAVWTVVDTGTYAQFVDVSGAAPDDVFAVGGDVIVHFDGERWSPVRVPYGAYIETVAATPAAVFFGDRFAARIHELVRARP